MYSFFSFFKEYSLSSKAKITAPVFRTLTFISIVYLAFMGFALKLVGGGVLMLLPALLESFGVINHSTDIPFWGVAACIAILGSYFIYRIAWIFLYAIKIYYFRFNHLLPKFAGLATFMTLFLLSDAFDKLVIIGTNALAKRAPENIESITLFYNSIMLLEALVLCVVLFFLAIWPIKEEPQDGVNSIEKFNFMKSINVIAFLIFVALILVVAASVVDGFIKVFL